MIQPHRLVMTLQVKRLNKTRVFQCHIASHLPDVINQPPLHVLARHGRQQHRTGVQAGHQGTEQQHDADPTDGGGDHDRACAAACLECAIAEV